jgi:The ARF-like 2 binding protein BART.
MIDGLIENLLKELNVSPELFLEIVELGMTTPADRKIFEQLVACNNFLSFKKLMIKRNKEIEVEVVKSMNVEGIATEEDMDYALEKQEIAEVGYALAMSIA